jgi:hypothetical protein
MTRSTLSQKSRRSTFILGLACIFSGLGSAQAAKNVEVIVNNALYSSGQINASLNQYLSNLQVEGYTPHLTTSSFANPDSLRTYLTNRYNSAAIEGAVMIGNLPIEHFERNGQFGNPDDYQRFACDLYYMDLNGSWSDSTGNGTFDTHTGNVSPEIWVGHMITSPLVSLHTDRTEASLLNSYFSKDNQYRWGQLSMPQNGLAYVDDDWIPWAAEWANNLDASVAGSVTLVSDGATTTADDFKSRLAPSTSPKYESALLCAHSGSDAHCFKIGGDWTGGVVYNYELAALNPQNLFYNLFACSNVDYEASGYMGGEYVFGTNLGLLAVGSTKTGSMLNFGSYYTPLGAGETFGGALLDWWQAQATGGFDDGEKDWFYGMTLIGDPLLRTLAFPIPEPAAWLLLLTGLGCGWLGRRFYRQGAR